nr:MAG TPA: hypothetical protein [Caudoviricetes sp.]
MPVIYMAFSTHLNGFFCQNKPFYVAFIYFTSIILHAFVSLL